MSYISTGQAAKLLMVTRDTVLKWIKQGKLPAKKTAGGHYRIPREQMDSLWQGEYGSVIPKGETEDGETIRYCWEHDPSTGNERDECRSCLVSRAGEAKCYEVADFLKKTGFGATCCPTSCDFCPYFLRHSSRSLKVLVFTEDEAFRESVARQFQQFSLDVRFTSWDYDCSFIIESFRPQYIIVDCQAGFETCKRLCKHLADDPRIPGVKIVLAGSFEEELKTEKGEYFLLSKPIERARIQAHIRGLEAARPTKEQPL